MKKLFWFAGALVALFALGGGAPALGTTEGVCPPLDTGHLSAGGATSLLVTAPAGKLIVAYCVKAGSVQQGNGPEFHSGSWASVTISHSSGKEISHYSVDYEDEAEPFDACPNLPGDQPEGYDCKPDEPPFDACPDVPGNQPEGSSCDPPSPPRTCPDGLPPTPGEGAFDPNDDCARPPVTPPASTSPPAAPPTAAPAPTPPVAAPPISATPTIRTSSKTKSAPKPKPPKKATPPKPDPPKVCLPLKDGTQRAWWKGGNGIKPGCYAIIRGSG